MISPTDVLQAETRIRPFIVKTSLDPSFRLSDLAGCDIWLKLEQTQYTGSFKLRGAANKVLSLTPEEIERGVITASNGNHGIAVCYAARQVGITPQVFMRHGVSEAKLGLIRLLGGEPVFFGEDPLEAELKARQTANETGKIFISPYNDAQVVAGQGTIGVELHRQLEDIDSVFITVGGGGLISGIATYLKAVSPKTRIVGCWPENSPVMFESLKAGRIFDCPEKPTISDSTAGGLEPDSMTFEMCQRLIDDHVLVSEEEIKRAMRMLAEQERWIVEGAAGVALAALLKERQRFAGQRCVVLLCGRNIAAEKMRELWP
ncbi:MAG TPA: threonine/serine dehydratase [Blastocatellia bacterium]|nr:threonine/serine dehydratase [Blastocatellia bacterium]